MSATKRAPRPQRHCQDSQGSNAAEWKALAVQILVAFVGGSQKELGRLAQLNPARISLYCSGKATPSLATLERLASAARLPLSFVEGVVSDGLTFRDAQRHQSPDGQYGPPHRSAPSSEQNLGKDLAQKLSAKTKTRLLLCKAATERLEPATTADLDHGEELWLSLEGFQPAEREAVIRAAPEFQTWALAVRLAERSWEVAPTEPQDSFAYSRLAVQVATRVGGSAAWRSRVQGFAQAHLANSQRANGELIAAEKTLAHAKHLFAAGKASDSLTFLPPSRLLILEAELRASQNKLREAISLYERARTVARSAREFAQLDLSSALTLEKASKHKGQAETNS